MATHDEEALARLLRTQTDNFKVELALRRLERLMLGAASPQIDLKLLPDVGLVSDTLDGLWLSYKATDDRQGVVEGYLAVFNNVDLGKDVIEVGAFKQTLAQARAFTKQHNASALWPLLWQHDRADAIGGIIEAREDSKGLFISARLNLDIEHGRQAYDGLKQGYLAFSIGYRPLGYSWQGNIRHLTEIALSEGSAVTFPMNQEARATGAKWEG
jgi:Escherichia/Staphylococcus phage prohead protease